ncbi:9205_t:CDS:2 [Ambispora gerdemannii]|uniref:9205_t:CDS:1 n=1 Tax=Ambispora gerdemannii TaxID=144530 RepID=A0A9N8Z857_9GLOM|nr:9205_t:CDS:2 [Ambispora gerdemannii]
MREKRSSSGSEEKKRIKEIDDKSETLQNDDLASEDWEPNWMDNLQKLPDDFRAVDPESEQSDTKPITTKKPSNSKSKSTEIKEIEKDILPYEERTAINDKLIAYYNRRERITDMNRTELIQELTDCAVNKDVGVNLAANLQKYLIRKYIPKHPFLIRAIQKWVKKEIKIRGEIPMD